MRTASLAPLAAVLLAAWGCSSETPELPAPERIILVSLDTVRADVLGDLSDGLLPNLERMATEGALFTNAYAAASYTLPAHAAMLTGLDAAEHPLSGENPALRPGGATLAERLREAGYLTQGFHEGGYVRGRYGFRRGFDEYRLLPRRALIGPRFELALDWISEHAGHRFFLFLHSYAAHDPYGGWDDLRSARPELGLPSKGAVRESASVYPSGRQMRPELIPQQQRLLFALFNVLVDKDKERVTVVERHPVEELAESPHFEAGVEAMRRGYGRRVRHIDAALGQLREHLEALGLWEDTLLIVTSDHGEAFFEHGQVWHGYCAYDEVLRVPLVVSYPRLFRKRDPFVSDALVWHLDLVPTLLALVGLEADPALGGVDLSALLRGAGSLPADRSIYPLISEVAFLPQPPPRRVAIRRGLKFIPHHPRFHSDGDMLFDLGRDPGETRNLLPERSDDARALRGLLVRYEASLRPPPPSRAPPLAGEELEDLRRLGYVE